jgi:hypothetical protein
MSADWSRRLLVGTGVVEVDGCFFPEPSWRAPTPDELPLLIRASDGPLLLEELEASVCLFQLPAHCHSAWWKLLEQASGVLSEGRIAGFDAFVREVGEFMIFKGLPVPEDARWDVVVSSPGRRFVHGGAQTRCPGGLLCNLVASAPWPWAHEHYWPKLWGGINLGDEATSVVLINLPCQQLDAEVHRRVPQQASAATVGELVASFLRSCSDYPAVRLVLGPAEGYRLPRGGLILDGYVENKQEPGVLLLISHQGQPST